MSDGSKPGDEGTERQFIHDLASPLATAIFLVDIAREDAASAELAESLKTVATALGKMKDLLHRRRAALIQKTEREAK